MIKIEIMNPGTLARKHTWEDEKRRRRLRSARSALPAHSTLPIVRLAVIRD